MPAMLPISLAALMGIGLLLRQSELPHWGALAGLAACSIAGLLVAGLRCRRAPAGSAYRPWVIQALACLSAAITFAAWASWQAQTRLSDWLGPGDDGAVHVVTVEVEGLPERLVSVFGQPSWRFEGQLLDGPRPGARGQFNWPQVGQFTLPEQLHAGDQWRLSLRLRNATGTRNPYGFDPETWRFAQGRLLSGTVVQGHDGPSPQALGQSTGLMARIDRLRAQVRDDIRVALEGQPHWGVMSGLTVGDQRSIDRESWKVFSVTGVSHLISISGMHVTMFAALARLLIAGLWRLASRPPLRLALYIPAPVASAIGASLAAFGYALLAGFNVPAQRTALMVAVAAMASLTGLRASPWGIIGLTLLLVIVLDPFSPLSPGFWLSFVAVVILFGQPSGGHAVREAVRAQSAITLGLAPLTAVLFQQISLVGPLANALAIPVVTFLVTPLAMVGTITLPMGWDWPLQGGRLLFDWLYQFLDWAASLSWASLTWHSPPAWAACMASLGAVLALQSSLGRWRHLAWLACGLLLLGRPSAPPPGHYQAIFWDIGQGSAVLVRTAEHTLVVDTGPMMGEATAAERVLAPQLWGLGLSSLSGLVISHADEDHASGLHDLALTFRPQWVLTSLGPAEWRRRFPRQDAPPTLSPIDCRLGVSWAWDGVQFRVISPVDGQEERQRLVGFEPEGGASRAVRSAAARLRAGNEASCVIEVVDAEGHRLILPGDIPAGIERSLVEQMDWLQTGQPTVLALAHHGSNTSSDEAFLRALSPVAAVTQSAYRGRFGHPHPTVLARLEALSIPVHRVDLMGALALEWGPEGPRFRALALENQGFWHLPRN